MASPQTINEMQDILHENRGEDSIDHILTEKQEARLHEIVKSIDRDRTINILTPAEQAEFAAALENGSLVDELAIWVPWWEQEAKHPGISEVGGEDSRFESVPEFNALCKKPPGEWLKHHLANILWSVAYVWRAYNGDIEYNEVDMLELLMTLSDSFAGRAKHEMDSFEAAVVSASTNAMVEDNDLAAKLIPIVNTDLPAILSSKAHIVTALFSVADLLQTLKMSSGKSTEALRKKLMFWLSYVKSSSCKW